MFPISLSVRVRLFRCKSDVKLQRFPLVGRNGHELDEKFASNPYGYFAIAMNNLPNYL
jgi:hypothetical protein